jgi:hypothetical protein
MAFLRGLLLSQTLALAPSILVGQAGTRPCDVLCLSHHARNALAARQYHDYVTYVRQIAARAPKHPGTIYAMARGLALIGQADSALVWLHRLARIGASRDLTSDSAFAALRDLQEFRTVQARLEANGTPITLGRPAFSMPDPDLLPEALAWDSSSGTWLVGSLSKRKVIRIAPDGSATDFLSAPELLRVVGIHVDSARTHLWFATWAPRADTTPRDDEPPTETRLFRCDLNSGRILRSYAPADSANSHLFNDLAIAPNGDVFVTDTKQGWIYRVRADLDSLEVYLRPHPDHFSGANGITFGSSGRIVYVAFLQGIARIDLNTRRTERLHAPDTTTTAGIDGLYWYRGALLAVQNAPGLEQIVRYELSSDGRAIRRTDILERGDSVLRLPTTGAVVGAHFYFIANSQFDRLGTDNELRPASHSPARTIVRVIDLP